MIGLFGVIWGLTGFSLLLVFAILRLTATAVDSFSYPYLWYHWVVLVITIVLMAYMEGYRGFQKGFSPRVAARVKYLYHHPRTLHVLLAPLYCMGYIYATKKRKIKTTALTLMIVLLVLLVRLLNQPWRGIIDVGVVVGLGWGLVSLFIFTVKAFTLETFNYDPEIPEYST